MGKNRILELLPGGRVKVQRPDGSTAVARPKAKAPGPSVEEREVAVRERLAAVAERKAGLEAAALEASRDREIAMRIAAEAARDKAVAEKAASEERIAAERDLLARQRVEVEARGARADELHAATMKAQAELRASADADRAAMLAEVGRLGAQVDGLGRTLAETAGATSKAAAATAEGFAARLGEQAAQIGGLKHAVDGLAAIARAPKTYTVKHGDGTETQGTVSGA